MLVGKGPSSNNYQKLCRKTEIRKCHCKTHHSQQKSKSNQSLKNFDTGQRTIISQLRETRFGGLSQQVKVFLKIMI